MTGTVVFFLRLFVDGLLVSNINTLVLSFQQSNFHVILDGKGASYLKLIKVYYMFSRVAHPQRSRYRKNGSFPTSGTEAARHTTFYFPLSLAQLNSLGHAFYVFFCIAD